MAILHLATTHNFQLRQLLSFSVCKNYNLKYHFLESKAHIKFRNKGIKIQEFKLSSTNYFLIKSIFSLARSRNFEAMQFSGRTSWNRDLARIYVCSDQSVVAVLRLSRLCFKIVARSRILTICRDESFHATCRQPRVDKRYVHENKRDIST